MTNDSALSSSPKQGNGPMTPERRAGGPGGGATAATAQSQSQTPAPPIVVVSPDQEELTQDPIIQRTSLIPLDQSPRAQQLSKMRNNAPKDTIPIVGKPPRKQRSSRFHINERVEIERLPSFAGEFASYCAALIRLCASVI